MQRGKETEESLRKTAENAKRGKGGLRAGRGNGKERRKGKRRRRRRGRTRAGQARETGSELMKERALTCVNPLRSGVLLFSATRNSHGVTRTRRREREVDEEEEEEEERCSRIELAANAKLNSRISLARACTGRYRIDSSRGDCRCGGGGGWREGRIISRELIVRRACIVNSHEDPAHARASSANNNSIENHITCGALRRNFFKAPASRRVAERRRGSL